MAKHRQEKIDLDALEAELAVPTWDRLIANLYGSSVPQDKHLQSLEKALSKLQAIDKRIEADHQREADALQQFYDSEIAGKTFGSLEANQRIAIAIQQTLNCIGKALECPWDDEGKKPVCNHPGQLRCRSNGFYVEHSIEGRQTSHKVADDQFPKKLRVVLAARRRKPIQTNTDSGNS